MDVGAILSRALSLYRRNLNLVLPYFIVNVLVLLIFLVFGIVAVVALFFVLGSVDFYDIESLMHGPNIFLLIAIFGMLLLYFLAVLLNALARAATIGMVIEAERDGKTSLNTGIESAKRHGLSVFYYIVAVSIIPGMVMISVGVLMILISVFYLSSGVSSGENFVLLALFLFIGFLIAVAWAIIYVIAIFTPQKILMENLGAIDGIRASYRFVRSHVTDTVIYIGAAFAVMTIMYIVILIFAVPATILDIMGHQFTSLFLSIFQNILSVAMSILIAPYFEAVKTLMVMEAGGEKSETESPTVL